MVRIFLSGRFDVGTEVEKAWLLRTGCKFRCFTYANIDKMSKHHNKRVIDSLKVCEDQGVGIMLDSGAASLHNIQSKTSKRDRLSKATHDVDTTAVANSIFDRYAKYCLANKDKWTFFVTLDFKKHQPTIFEMQKRFERVGLRPTPVYHGDSSLDWLNKYADRGYKLIGVGSTGSARSRHNIKSYRYYLDKVFNRCAKLDIELHGLAVTGLSLMLSYPWWSVDSATWTKTASYGNINVPDFDKGVIFNVHVSERASTSDHSYNKMSSRHQAHIRETVKELGFDFKELHTSVAARHDFNGYVFSHLSEIGLDNNKIKSVQWESLI